MNFFLKESPLQQSCLLQLLMNLFVLIMTLTVQSGFCEVYSIQRVKNFKIETKPTSSVELEKRDVTTKSKNPLIDAMSAQRKRLPDEFKAQFEAFGKHFIVSLKKNEALLPNDLKIEVASDGSETIQIQGAPYIGSSLEIANVNEPTSAADAKIEHFSIDGSPKDLPKSNSFKTTINDPFARFYVSQLPDGQGFRLQGGFEWENVFFRLGSGKHPHVRYHVSPPQISLLKRNPEETRTLNTQGSKDPDYDADLVITKESMDPKRAQTSSFNRGSNSTLTFRCGHEDLGFNTNPRDVGDDFAKKLTSLSMFPDLKGGVLRKRDETTGCPVTRKVLYVGVAADSAYLAKFDGNRQEAISNILNDFNLVSAIYEKTFNIEVGIISLLLLDSAVNTVGRNSKLPDWNLPCVRYTISDRLNAFSKWREEQSKDAGLYHLVSGCSDSETVGIAWLNQVCQTSSFKAQNSADVVSGTSVSVLIPNQFAVMAHEIGHNFGAVHDCDAEECGVCRGNDCKCCTCGPCDCKGRYVMNPESGGLNVKEFSPCSQSDICYKMNVLGKCLQDSGRVKTLKKSICGNGILEEGEECDCGSEEECRGNPCCQFGCKLKAEATCSDQNHPCCNKCQIRKAEERFACFQSKTKCKSDSICDGGSGLCPVSQTAANGASCEVAGGKCASGVCTSRDMQCRVVGRRLGILGACKETPRSCQLICEGSEKGACYSMSANFLNGTPCGRTGFCSDGECSESMVSSFMQGNSAIVIVAGVLVGALLFVILFRSFIKCVFSTRGASGGSGGGSGGSGAMLSGGPYGHPLIRTNNRNDSDILRSSQILA